MGEKVRDAEAVHGNGAGTDDGLGVYTAVRGRLFGIAYRMLGSVVEAEDVLQDVWLRWQGYDRASVENPAAFLATATTRLAINVSQSSRLSRAAYIGPWLPEPVDTSNDPALGAERGEALEVAVLMLLEKLNPHERAAYVLREAFDYPYPQIAEIIQHSQASARQLVSRARRHLAAERRASVAVGDQRRLLDAFLRAAQSGDLVELEALFAADVVSYSDGGGAVRASRFPVVGRERVARFVRAFHAHFWEGVTINRTQANGHAALVLERDGDRVAVITVGVTDQGIDRLLWMMNPAKLSRA